MSYIVVALTAYLLGSIPTGYLVARARGVDIRSLGSGNIGATNVFRVLGKPAGIAVLVFDGLKGFAACAWMSDLIIQFFKVPPDETVYLRLAAAQSCRSMSAFGGETECAGRPARSRWCKSITMKE